MFDMLKTTIIGASGYTGAELALMVHKHHSLHYRVYMFQPRV